MKIRLYDKFDYGFTVAKRDNVEAVYRGIIYYADGEEEEFDEEYEDWEDITGYTVSLMTDYGYGEDCRPR